MAQPRGFGSFDPTLTTKFGPTGTEQIDAINRGIQQGLQQGQIVARAIEQSRRAKLDAENARILNDTRQMQMYKMHTQQREGLYFEDDTKVDGIQNARAAVSTMLVNKANELYQAYEKGDISGLQYKKGMSILEGEVGKYKVAEETIRVNAEKYLAGVENGTLSNTNSAKVESWWAAVADGTAKLEYTQDKNGQIVIEGEWDDPTDNIKGKVRVPLGDIEKMSTVRYQPKEDVNDYMTAEAKSAVEAKVQNTIAQKGSISDLKGVDFKNPDDPTRKELTTIFENNFEEYIGALGEGDKVSQIGQYIMDTGKGNYLVSEALLNNYDDVGSKNMDTMKDLEYLMSKGKLDSFKEELKKDYVERSLATYNAELATAQGTARSARLKQAGADALNQQRINAVNKTSTGSSYTPTSLEKDFVNIATNLKSFSSDSGKFPKSDSESQSRALENLQTSIDNITSKGPRKDNKTQKLEKINLIQSNLANSGISIVQAEDEKGNPIDGQYDILKGDFLNKEIKGLDMDDILNWPLLSEKILMNDKRLTTKEARAAVNNIKNAFKVTLP
tara:strand:+ start:731 stop:2407 length:1677 start_codon:yes stop_codon:yes gene_type:complete